MAKKLIEAAVEASIQEAIYAELFASHLYKRIATQLQRIGYFGAAKHFRDESADELEHYQRHVDFLNDMGSVAETPALPECAESVPSLLDAIELSYETECALLESYSNWYKSADPVTAQHLLQFIEIQRKSVGEYGDLMARIELVGDDKCGLLIIDKELGE